MPTENNDFGNWVLTHTAQEKNHEKNTRLNKREYYLKEAEYNIAAYCNSMAPYAHPLAVVLKDEDPKYAKMTPKELKEQACIQLKEQKYTTTPTRFGPYRYAA